MKVALVLLALAIAVNSMAADGSVSMKGLASWYGEAHRGRLMANGEPFNPDKFTAASWFYPLGTRVRVTLQSRPEYSIIVVITDRGPARRFVRKGRIIDLAHGAFEQLAAAELGLIAVNVEPLGFLQDPAGW
jgi:rare lipoprotein A